MIVDLLGRSGVAARLDDALERSADGLATVVTLVGEIGMGRTALLTQLRQRAEDGDRLVLATTGRVADSDIGFSSLLSLLRPVEDRIEELVGERGEALRAALDLSPGTTEPTQVRLALFRLLTNLAAERPVVVLLDDAHLLDRSTWDALRFAIGRLDADQIAVVLSVEPTSDLSDDLDGETVILEPLDDHDLHAILDHLDRPLSGGGRPEPTELAPEVRATCLQLSSGNPLVAVEYIRSLSDGQRRGREPLPTMPEPPAALAMGFEAALAAVPSNLWPALVVIAADLSGDIGVLNQVLADLEQPPSTLDELERTGFIEIEDRTVYFGHPLLGQFVLYRSSARSRRAAHRALARALDRPDQRAARAWHRAAAAEGPDEEAAAALDAVAEDGFTRGGAASAARAFERAAELSPSADDRAARLAEALRCWLAVGDIASVRRLTELLERTASAEADVDDAIAVGLRWTGGEHRVIARLEEAIDGAAGPADSVPPDPGPSDPAAVARRRRVLALLGDAHAAMGERPLAIDRIGELTGGDDAPAALAAAVLALVDPGLGPGAGGPSPFDGVPMTDLADRATVVGARTRLRRAEVLTAWGLHREARAELGPPDDRTGWDPAEEAAVRARALTMAGEIGGAFELLNRRLDQLPRGADLPRAVLSIGLAEIELLMGRLDAAGQHLGEALPRLQSASAFADTLRGRRSAARLAMATGDHDRAVSELLLSVGRAPEFFTVELTSALLALDRADEAERLFGPGTLPEAGALPSLRSRVTTALLTGDDDGLRAAADEADRLALPLEAAEIHLHRAETAFRQGRHDDLTVFVAEASGRLTALGVGGWRARLQRLSDAPRSEARRRVADTLTEAEHRVAVTVASGRTNKEAAAELFLSQKTVDYHLQNIYRKLEIRSRTELAALLAQGE
ncbi:MAG: AAA family ATPase [Actinomycetota bacterium]